MNATQIGNQVTPVTLGGAIAAVIVWLIGDVFFPEIEIPNEIAIAFGTICIFAVQRGWRAADPLETIKKNPLEPNR